MEKYKIKSFSQHMGVSLDTIKHYQQCGIISPEIDPENNYRYYNVTHGERLIVSRRFRNLGFNLEDTKELVSSKSGTQIKDMLCKRQKEIDEEMQLLKKKQANVTHYIELCDLFLNHAETYELCNRPAYYYYTHTYEMSFIQEKQSNTIVKHLMNELPLTRKLMILPYNSIVQEKNIGFHHTIAFTEDCLSDITSFDLSQLEYSASIPAIRYIYSRPYSLGKAAVVNQIRQELISAGYSISSKDVFCENAIDFYDNNIRFDNFIIYFPLKSS